MAALRRNTDGRGAVLVLSEPELDRVLEGTIPTASGYRTLRAVPRPEVRAALTAAVGACRDAGAASVVLDAGAAGVHWAPRCGADTVVVPLPAGSTREWEPLAALHEAGLRLCFDSAGTTELARTAVQRLLGPWHELGMEPAALLGTVLAPSFRISELAPPQLPDALRRVTGACGALTEACNEG